MQPNAAVMENLPGAMAFLQDKDRPEYRCFRRITSAGAMRDRENHREVDGWRRRQASDGAHGADEVSNWRNGVISGHRLKPLLGKLARNHCDRNRQRAGAFAELSDQRAGA